jgi:succinate-semialdehyde dehydrogenase/glutarate-semialdehyde dehydrogenase
MPEVTTTDPTTGEPLATYPASDVDGARSVLAAVHAAQPAWAALPVEARADVVRAIGAQLVLKHSPDVTGCALAIEQVFRDAGLPEDVFRSIVVAADDVPEVSRTLIADDRIAAVSLTGSERAGSAVAAAAGRAVKKSLLELGGSDPFVVLADADLDLAVAGAVTSRFTNSGQSCLAAKRFVVHAAVAGEFGRQITSGALFVNAVVASDPRLPFGGTKRSGYGRELGEAGALEFTNARTCVVGAGTLPSGPATE